MIVPIRSIAAAASAGDAVPSAGASDLPALLRVFWYPLDSAEIDDQIEPLPHSLADLVGATHRLDMALGELHAMAARRDLSQSIESIEFRLENFAGRLGELRERLVNLLIEAALHPARRPLSNGSAGQNGDAKAPASLGAQLVGPIERLLALIDDDLPLRDPRARRTFLHLSLFVDGAMCDPSDAGASARAHPDERRRLNRLLRQEVRGIAARCAERVALIVEQVVAVLDQAAGVSQWR